MSEPDPIVESVVEVNRPDFVVGLGASAGGLESLELFFANVDTNTKMAFIVAQHLSPNFDSMMDELLARQTKLPIVNVDDDMLIEAGHVYLLPPRKEMIIAGGRMLVTDKDPQEDFFLPIDRMLRSLGQDQRQRAIGVILSGTGGDGTRGIEQIHRSGGLVVVQSEQTAAFDGMIRSALNTGLVDLVLPPDEIPIVIQRYANNPTDWRSQQNEGDDDLSVSGPTARILKQIRDSYGIDFSHYKPDMIARRIERRSLIDESEDIDSYAKRLLNDEAELSALYRDMLIGVTGFFRDPDAYAKLESTLLPKLIRSKNDGDELRVWVAATATGEEAYSIAILIHEYLENRDLSLQVRIFATDVHQASLETAAAGFYSETRVRDLTHERLGKYFDKEGHGYRICPEIRKMVVFAEHNVITDAPFTKLDLITCRNLFIYLKPDVQRRVLMLFHFGLTLGGGLWLGSSEVPSELTEEFDALDSHWKLFTKRRNIRLTQRVRVPMSAPGQLIESARRPPTEGSPVGLLATYDALLEWFMPPSMLLSESRELIQSFAGASQFIRPSDGRVSSDIIDQLDPEIRVPLSTAMRRAQREQRTIELSSLRLTSGTEARDLNLRVRPLVNAKTHTKQYLVEFRIDQSVAEKPPADSVAVDLQAASNEHVSSLERELQHARQSLNTTIEELQAANEEMQSTNEELVASNEELQSTNEELHSVNEELYTVNAEYQRKIRELTELTDDMENLLNSTHVDTIFLDCEMRIRKFTPNVADKFNLLRQDIGRDFDSFTYRLEDDELIEELRMVLRTETVFEREVSDRKGNVYLMRIFPYVSRDRVDGVVLTLVDITNLKSTQARLAILSEIVEQSDDAIFRVDQNGLIRTWNRGAFSLYGHDESIIGRPFSSLFPDSYHDQVDELIGNLSSGEDVAPIETKQLHFDGRLLDVAITFSSVRDERGQRVASSVIARDISERVAAQEEIRQSIVRRDQFLAMLSHELRNPLGAIVNAARLLADPTWDQTEDSRAMEVIIRQSEQMSRLLDDLLDVSRITHGKIELKTQPFDLRSVIDEAIRVIQPDFEVNDLHFEYQSCETPLFVDGDPARLQQVAVNLLRNAVKYTPDGGQIVVKVLRDRDDCMQIRIRDTGVGIDVESQEKIFDVFVQVNSSLERSQGGIGLGLTLVKSIVTLHGGNVEVFSDGPGTGTEFRVQLPLTRLRPERKRVHRPASEVKTIAIVEDIRDAREMLSGLLKLKGYEVLEAENGRTGLELIRNQRPDVSLVDIGLPEVDGYELVRQIRCDHQTADLFLVALTGYGQTTDRTAVQEAGFDAHLVKPLNLDELQNLLSNPRHSVEL